jgi:hypothetical protein
MSSLAPASTTRDLLLKLCGMLGSEHHGERAAAALKITELMQSAGLRWDDLLSGSTASLGCRGEELDPERHPAEVRVACRRWTDWRADLAFCRRHQDWLSDADLAYVNGLLQILGSGRTGLRASDHTSIAIIASRLRRHVATSVQSPTQARDWRARQTPTAA